MRRRRAETEEKENDGIKKENIGGQERTRGCIEKVGMEDKQEMLQTLQRLTMA